MAACHRALPRPFCRADVHNPRNTRAHGNPRPQSPCTCCDQGSTRHTARSVAFLVNDLIARENHIVAGLGISDGSTDFRAVFREMGIPDRWILTPGSKADDIRRAFQLFSHSALRVSQSAAGLSQVSLGGFGN
jgi:hypothetical protein